MPPPLVLLPILLQLLLLPIRGSYYHPNPEPSHAEYESTTAPTEYEATAAPEYRPLATLSPAEYESFTTPSPAEYESFATPATSHPQQDNESNGPPQIPLVDVGAASPGSDSGSGGSSMLRANAGHPTYPSGQSWPQWSPPPTGPFFDEKCFGKSRSACIEAYNDHCRWYTFNGPHCYDYRFLSVGPAPDQQGRVIPTSVKYFDFAFGVHLVEGTFTRTFYNTLVDECALLCLNATNGFNDAPGLPRIMCKSFEFYPFEVPLPQAPYFETINSGICTLNSETKDTARQRNEDEGFTDAELYYKSHHTTRPFSPQDGYYQVRDPRGGYIATMLEYGGGPSRADLGLSAPFGGSRWGLFHPDKAGYLPSPMTPGLVCDAMTPAKPPSYPSFRGGFTPITPDQHCPGPMSKADAVALCASAGAELCSNRSELHLLAGRKLGCGYDTNAIGMLWYLDLPQDHGPLFPRCCVTHTEPFSPVSESSCSMYEQSNIEYCKSLNSATKCILGGSGVPLRYTEGFSTGLDDIRQLCLDSGQASCFMMEVGNWTAQTRCLWCPSPGLLLGGGNGTCRAGGSYGICEGASNDQRQIFGLRARSVCSDQTNCNLSAAYPDLEPFLFPANGGLIFSENPLLIGDEGSGGGSEVGSLEGNTDGSTRPTSEPSHHPATTTTRPTTSHPVSARPTTSTIATNRPASPTATTAKNTLHPTTGRPTSHAQPVGSFTFRPTPESQPKPTNLPVHRPTHPTHLPSSSPTTTTSPTPSVSCPPQLTLSECAKNFPWCKWDAVHTQCTLNPNPSVWPVLPCSVATTLSACRNRPASAQCVWLVNTEKHTGQCIRQPGARKSTSAPLSEE